MKRNQKGFTLMEMLIVVAIIAILVAISIPIFSTQLEKAKTATDEANLRAAKAVAAVSYLDGTLNGDGETEITDGTTYYYDAESGTLLEDEPEGYGKSGSNSCVIVIFSANKAPLCVWNTDEP